MKQFSGFFILGALSTIIDLVIYSFFISISFNYIIAIVLGYSGGFLFNFYIGRKYIFKNGSKFKFSQEFIYTLLIVIMGLLLNILIVYLFNQYSDIDLIISRVVAIVLVFFWNYFARKIFIYH